MKDREELIADFLNKNGWGNAERRMLAADASFRRYDRLFMDGKTMVFMDAPPPMENVRPFVKVAKCLEKNGYSAPHLYAVDEENGFILLEDFGDSTYTRLLNAGENEEDLYALAIDVLADMHSKPEADIVPEGLPLYDVDALLKEAMLFPDWFMPAAFGHQTDKEVADEYALLWEEAFALAGDVPQTMVLRDYHVDNLMRLDGRDGVKACGLLDFQDALHGAVSYDVMSLMEDARRDISPELFIKMQNRYLEAMGDKIPDKEKFLTSWAVLAAGRHAKVLGIFVRLCVRDHKPRYLHHLPRLWRLLERALEHPALSGLKLWFNKYIPPEQRGIPECLLIK